MWKEMLSGSALVLSLGLSAHLISQAYAIPTTSLGANPTASFGGSLSSSAVTILTTPNDQAFVVKTMMFDGFCSVYVAGSLMLEQNSQFIPAYYYHNVSSAASTSGGTAFIQGRANLTVPAGSTLEIRNCSGNRFYMDGHYVHP